MVTLMTLLANIIEWMINSIIDLHWTELGVQMNMLESNGDYLYAITHSVFSVLVYIVGC